jgi:hypothetical protein
MGSLWCLQKVISYLSLSICLSISSSLFNRHLWFTFGLYADLVCPQLDEEGVQGLRRAVRRSHGRRHQVDALLKECCQGPPPMGPLFLGLGVFLGGGGGAPRPTLRFNPRVTYLGFFFIEVWFTYLNYH